MAEQVSFLHAVGGLLSGAVLAELLNDKPKGPAGPLADVDGFQLPGHPAPSRKQLEEDVELAYRTTEAAWSVLRDRVGDDLDVGRLRERFLLPLLRELGFDPQYQKAHLVGDDGKSYAITHLGWDGPAAPPMILTGRDLDERSGRQRSPHQELQAYLNAASTRWGIVANAREVRILRDFHHTTTQGAVICDLADLLEAGSFPDFRAFYRIAHASRFTPRKLADGEPRELLEDVYQESLAEGVAVGRALQPQVRQALTHLLNGILEGDAALRRRLRDDPGFGRVLYGELLTVLYRILFLLYAEQRGLLHDATEVYRDSYSVTRLRDLAERRTPEPRRGDLWEGLKAAFSAFVGDEELANVLGVHPYNGQLFDPNRTPHLSAATCSNRHLLDAMRALTTVEIGRVRQYVDYRHLGVEELGSVYESLLNYTIRIADEPGQQDGIPHRAGQGFLAPLSTERAELGAYYTPPRLVDLTLSKALDGLIEQRLDAHPGDPAAQEAALLDLRVVDPACGSAAFLIGAIDRIAQALADVRTSGQPVTDADVQRARRDVLQHCIYGVDVDPFAVELAKVALWIHCTVGDLPLGFLDHKIVCGNSLVGWPMFEIPKEIPRAAYDPPKGTTGKAAAPYRAARDRNDAYLSQFAEHQDDDAGTLALQFLPVPDVELVFPEELFVDDATVEGVHAKADAYRRYLESDRYRILKRAADVWTAAFFWTSELGEFPTSKEYHQAIEGDLDGWDGRLADALEEVNPLHWPLAFPDIHARGGFDLVIGNPPWEKFVTEEQEFFAAAGRFDIASQTSARRKQAIAALADGIERERALHDRWVRHKAANDRMSHWAKTSGRFTPVSGEVNTYVLFTELAADLSSDRGWVSLVVKSGIAIDKTPAPVFHQLLDSGRIRSVIDTVNKGGTFPAVAEVERFGVLTLGPRRQGTTFSVSMLNFSLDEAIEKDPTILTAEEVWVGCPLTGTLLSAPDKDRYQLAIDLHRRLRILDIDGENPWQITYATLFHSSGDSGLFLRKEDLEADGWVLGRDKVFRHPDGREALPVLEGQLVNMFDHRAKSYERYTGAKKYGRKPNVPATTDEEKADPQFEAEPRYWMDARVARERLEATVGNRAMVTIRDVGRPWTDQRIVRATLVPRLPATDTIPVLAIPVELVREFSGVLNSTPFDFLARAHMPSGHLARTWVLSQIAVPRPGLDSRIAELSERLSVTSTRLAEEYGFTLHRWDPEQRERDLVELDALVAKTGYGLSRDEYELILDSFDVMRRAQEKEHGEYRFKRLCLEAYDRI